MPGNTPLFSLDGKVCLVTGGGRGIGNGIARAFAAAGADVVLTGRTEAEIKAAADDIARETGRKCLAVKADLIDPGAAEVVVARTLETFAGIDVLVNNAGMNIRKPFLEMTPDDYDRVMALNARAVFFFTQAVVRRMIERGNGGKIINIASLSSIMGIQNISVYGMTKGAVQAFTKSMAVELAPHDICVNAIGPGYIRTKLTEAVFEDPQRYEWMLSRIPQKRHGVPDDIGGAAVFLASPASDYVTGIVLYVDGGWTSA